jgi:hypothetical protein
MTPHRLAIMQPYIFPYIGYFQLINAADTFVIYDDIKFTKKGWINRNRILNNGNPYTFTVNLRSDSDYLSIVNRVISDVFFSTTRYKYLRIIKESYSQSPFYNEVIPIIETCLLSNETNLFVYIYHSLTAVMQYLDIKTKLIISSKLPFNHNDYKGPDKVIQICKHLNFTEYVNSIGGQNLYDNNTFKNNGIKLQFIKRNDSLKYNQFNDPFVNDLSIIDVLMFNGKENTKHLLNSYSML